MILDFKTTEDILNSYGLNVPQSFLVKEKEGAVEAGNKIGYPVVLKISSETILHRTEIGGVITNIKNEEELKNAFDALEKIKEKEGIIVQKEIKGAEFIVGAKEDLVFNTVIMFGTGGIMVELFSDVSFRVAPISENDAREMIEEIKGKKLLEGFRGKPIINKEKVVDVLVKTAKLAFEKKVKELDFNPVIINEEGVFICDVKITL
jgi:acyl-CoA synthetase (NDP forming)